MIRVLILSLKANNTSINVWDIVVILGFLAKLKFYINGRFYKFRRSR